MYRGHGGHCFHRLLFLHKSEQVGWVRYEYSLVAVSLIPVDQREGIRRFSLCCSLQLVTFHSTETTRIEDFFSHPDINRK